MCWAKKNRYAAKKNNAFGDFFIAFIFLYPTIYDYATRREKSRGICFEAL